MKKRPNRRHEIDRIVVGNQIAILRAIQAGMVFDSLPHSTIRIRIHDTKAWWRDKFGEEVGFDSRFDIPPEKTDKRG